MEETKEEVRQEYYWECASLAHGADPNKVAAEIKGLKEANGKPDIEPQELVDMARDPETESHKYFDWNDSSAAEKYRRTQARGLLNNIKVTEIVVKRDPPNTFCPVTIVTHQRIAQKTANTKLGYQLTEDILKDPAEYANLLLRAHRTLVSVAKTYNNLRELRPITEPILQFNIQEIFDKANAESEPS